MPAQMPALAPTLADYERFSALRAGAPAPKVTVVTVAWNAAATIERTIDSLQAQTFQDFEHVVVDGGSTDGTLDILRRRLRPQDFWLSERDGGISDAFNRGVALARGQAVQFLNADDWMSPDQLAVAWAALEAGGSDFVFGDLVFYEGDRPVFFYRGDPDYGRVMDGRMGSLNHPTVLARRSCFERIGLFDPQYRCAMDYDWFLRLHRAGGSGRHDPAILGHMTHDGVSNALFKRTIDEVRRIAVAHGRPAWRASAEARYRLAKTSLGRQVKHWAGPLYGLVRKVTNRSYDSAIPVRAGAGTSGSGTAP
jgi:glycosyltransferase involved in cell wall biosynthesis